MDLKMFVTDVAEVSKVSTQAVHKKLKYHDLKVSKMANKSYFGHKEARTLFNLKFSPKIVACQIVKGGVGKTTIVANLAMRANLYGAKVLLIDLDQQGNLTEAFKFEVTEENPIMIDVISGEASIEDAIVNIADGIDLVPSAIENSILDTKLRDSGMPLDRVYKKILDKVKDNYDVILIDCPPALGPSVGAVALTADLLLAPINPDRYSLSGLKLMYQQLKELEENHETKIEFKIMFNRFTNATLSKEIYDGIYGHDGFNSRLMSTQIRERQEFRNKDAGGKTIFSTSRKTEPKDNIDTLTRELFGLNEQLVEGSRIKK